MDARLKRTGFTLIELVCVLVLLGILAAVAAPLYTDMTEDARRGAVTTTVQTFTSALTMAHTACALRRWAGRDNLPGYAAGNVDFNAACLPTDSVGNANTIANNNGRCMNVWTGILAGAPTITTAASGADYRAKAQSQVCTFQYLLDAAVPRQFTYDSRNGAIVVTNP